MRQYVDAEVCSWEEGGGGALATEKGELVYQ